MKLSTQSQQVYYALKSLQDIKFSASEPLCFRGSPAFTTLLINGTTKKRRTFNRHVSGDTSVMVATRQWTCCLTGTSRSVHRLPGDCCIYTVPGDDLQWINWWILFRLMLPYRSWWFSMETSRPKSTSGSGTSVILYTQVQCWSSNTWPDKNTLNKMSASNLESYILTPASAVTPTSRK